MKLNEDGLIDSWTQHIWTKTFPIPWSTFYTKSSQPILFLNFFLFVLIGLHPADESSKKVWDSNHLALVLEVPNLPMCHSPRLCEWIKSVLQRGLWWSLQRWTYLTDHKGCPHQQNKWKDEICFGSFALLNDSQLFPGEKYQTRFTTIMHWTNFYSIMDKTK